jgi:hypothetical protein
MAEKSAGEMAAALSLLIRQKLGVKAEGYAAKLARAGRLMPPSVRKSAAFVADAAALEGNPHLARQTDSAALKRAYAEVETYLRRIDLREKRVTALLRFFGGLAINLILVALLLIWVLHQRGLL